MTDEIMTNDEFYDEPDQNQSSSDFLIPDLDGHDLPTWYHEMKQFKPQDIVPISRRRTAGRDLQHLVWITKYRKEILYGSLRDSIELSLRFKAVQMQVEIMELAVMPDHVHMIIDKPKGLSISQIAQGMKGLSSRKVKLDFPELMDEYNIESALWAKRYFSCSVGAGSANKVREYINNQSILETK